MPALIDKREARIRRMFGEIAPRYDLLNHLLSLNIDRYWRRQTTKLVPPRGDAPILDVCTGTGDLAFAYVRASGGSVPIVGADFCHPMLVRAMNKKAKRLVGFVEADAQSLPFPDDTFQITCVAFGLRNITDTDRGLAEMVRVTQPGGRVAILATTATFRPWNRASAQRRDLRGRPGVNPFACMVASACVVSVGFGPPSELGRAELSAMNRRFTKRDSQLASSTELAGFEPIRIVDCTCRMSGGQLSR